VATYDAGSALTFIDAQLSRINVFRLGG
jgi:hypothetical protein